MHLRITARRRSVSIMAAIVLVTGTLGIFPAQRASADTTNLGCPTFTSLSNAISQATSGDTLQVACSQPTVISWGTTTISKQITIDASSSGAPITLDGGGLQQLFRVTSSGSLTIQNMVLTRGSGNVASGGGGVINNAGGTVIIANSVVRSTNFGGAIVNNGTMTVRGSLFTSNSSITSNGGAIRNTGDLTVSNSTFTGNNAGNGGAIYSSDTGTLSLSFSTITGNKASKVGGGLASDGNVTLQGNIIWNNTAPTSANCQLAAQVDMGFNLTDSTASCPLSRTNDVKGLDPQLGPLTDNGGPTPTMAPADTSPAVGKALAAACPATDQRGFLRLRKSLAACTIGAFEVGGISPAPLVTGVQQCRNKGLWNHGTSKPLLPSWPLSPQPRLVTADVHGLVAGWVFLDGYTPVAGATVRVVDSHGRLLTTAEDVTNENGVFVIHAAGLPASFRVVSTGGQVQGSPFNGTLTSRVNGYAHLRPMYLDAATSLVDRYVALHRGTTVASATRIVKHMLKVPAWADLGSSLQTSDRYFSAASFLQRAGRNGGVNRFITGLTTSVGGSKVKPFQIVNRRHTHNAVATWILGKLAEGALRYIGGKGMAWVTAKLGFDEDGKANDEQFAALREQLNAIQRDTQSILAGITEIKGKIDQQTLTLLVQPIDAATNQIDSAEAGIRLIADSASKPGVDRVALACAVLDWYIQPVADGDAALAIKNAFTSTPAGVKPLMLAYIDATLQGGRWINNDMSVEIVRSLDYWETYQALYAHIRLEWEHAKGCPASPGCLDTVEQIVPTVQGYMQQEEALLPRVVPQYTVLDTTTSVMWGPVGSPPSLWTVPVTRDESSSLIQRMNSGTGGWFNEFRDWGLPTSAQYRDLASNWNGPPNWRDRLSTAPPQGPGFNRGYLDPPGSTYHLLWMALPSFLSSDYLSGVDVLSNPPGTGYDCLNCPTRAERSSFLVVRSEPNASQYWHQRSGGRLSSGPAPTLGPQAVPFINQEAPGRFTAGFDVYFTSTDSGSGRVLFGSGPGCNGLIGTATQDDSAEGTDHHLHVMGDDYNLMAGGILPGQTYSFEVQTLTDSGVETDNNNGECYTVSIPSS